MSYPHLLSPGRIGTMSLRNRILMCPMGDDQATDGGYVTPQQVAYFEARARGGVALLIVGSVGITAPEGLASPHQSAIGNDSFVEGWAELANRVHKHGAKVALQLVHNGKAAVEDLLAGRPLMVPSLPTKQGGADSLMGMLTPGEASRMGTPASVTGAKLVLHEMTADDIQAMAERYANAVARAARAGIDGCELHAGHGYLIDNFLSPTTNRREDEYGGPVENRARFLVEIIEATRRKVGNDYPLWCRINGEELFIDGENLDDACRVAELAEAAGADAVHVSAYADPARAIGYTEAHATHIPGRFIPLAEAVKKRVEVPVIAVGRIEPDEAETLISQGRADFVAMGRKLLADPDLPNKLVAGTPEAIRPCMYHYRCISQIFERSKIRCAVNSLTGFEADRKIEPARDPHRVLVIGGGPAGMEAARLASLRGHEVVLAEASGSLGGRFALAARTAEPNKALLRWFEGEMERQHVEVRLETRVQSEDVGGMGFDEVYVATGARWPRPEVPGAELSHVKTVDEIRPWLCDESIGAANEIATEAASKSGSHVVVLGGDRTGLAIAGVARARGAEVLVLEPGHVFAEANGMVGRWRYVHDAEEMGIRLIGGADLREIRLGAVDWVDAEGRSCSAKADRVIVSSGAIPDTRLVDALVSHGIAARALGDCESVGFVEGAVQRAAELILRD